jgi:hypothetical protein
MVSYYRNGKPEAQRSSGLPRVAQLKNGSRADKIAGPVSRKIYGIECSQVHSWFCRI